MPAHRRPARAIALALAEDRRRRLLGLAVHCALAAVLVAMLL